MNNLTRCCETAAARQVRLEDVETAAFDQLLKAPFGGLLLSAGDARFHCFRYLAVAIVIFGV